LNFVGQEKLKKLKDEFGSTGFSYIGDSKKDVSILESSVHAYIVKNWDVFKKVSKVNNQATFFKTELYGMNIVIDYNIIIDKLKTLCKTCNVKLVT
jgi:predicted mannosyl-3-phosphoglycerate phosphatase (HAD superfamily)